MFASGKKKLYIIGARIASDRKSKVIRSCLRILEETKVHNANKACSPKKFTKNPPIFLISSRNPSGAKKEVR